MEKKKKLDVSNIELVGFEGFYQTIWDSAFEVSDYEYRNEVVEDKDFTFDNDSYQGSLRGLHPAVGTLASTVCLQGY